MGTEQALKNGLSAYQYNMLKLLMEWQPVVFNSKDDAIAWRNMSTGDELYAEMLDDFAVPELGEPIPRVSWGRIDVLEKCLSGCEQDNLRRKSDDLLEYFRLLERWHEERFSSQISKPEQDDFEAGQTDISQANKNKNNLVSLLDHLIYSLFDYREKHQDLITFDDLRGSLLPMVETLVHQYEYAYSRQVSDCGELINYQYGIERRYLNDIDGVLEPNKIKHLSSEQLEDARIWLIDCFPNQEDEIREESDSVIESEVIRLYGSLEVFIDDGMPPEEILISPNLVAPLEPSSISLSVST